MVKRKATAHLERNKGPIKLVCMVLVLLLLVLPISGGARGDEVEDLQSQLEAYKANLEEVRAKLDQASSYQSDLLNQLDVMNAEMYDLEADFAFYQGKTEEASRSIAQYSSSIENKTAEVKVIEKQLKERQDVLGQRLATLYKLNRGKYLQILLSSTDFAQFGARLTYFQRVFREDQSLLLQTKELIGSFEVQKLQLQEESERLKVQQELYAKLKAETEARKGQMEQDIGPKKAELVTAADEQAALQGQESELAKAIEQDQQKIADLLSTHDFVYTGEPSSAGLIWPIDGRLTSYFGWRDWGDYHRGVDIGAAYGSPIAAAAGGIVITVDYLGSYGNIVIIDHLNGISTVYAHLSGFNVGVGEEVSQGQVIGWIGLTGYTTGPHLHFEVRVSGEFVDPLGWLP